MREIDRNESRARKKRERKTFERKENRKFKKPESFVGGNGETVLSSLSTFKEVQIKVLEHARIYAWGSKTS